MWNEHKGTFLLLHVTDNSINSNSALKLFWTQHVHFFFDENHPHQETVDQIKNILYIYIIITIFLLDYSKNILFKCFKTVNSQRNYYQNNLLKFAVKSKSNQLIWFKTATVDGSSSSVFKTQIWTMIFLFFTARLKHNLILHSFFFFF